MKSLIFVLLFVVSCASIVKPQSTDQSIAYAVGTLTGFANTTAAMLETGRISRENAVKVNTILQQAELLLSMARNSNQANESDAALRYLYQAQSVLLQVQQLLNEWEKANAHSSGSESTGSLDRLGYGGAGNWYPGTEDFRGGAASPA